MTRTTHDGVRSLEELAKRLWGTGEWSDMIVASKSRQIRVHKAVLCLRSSFFAAACQHGFAEAISGHINLQEEDRVVDAILRHIYFIEEPLFGSVPEGFAMQSESVKLGAMTDLVQLYMAADKYDLPDLKPRVTSALRDRLEHVQDPTTVTTLANVIYDSTPDNDLGIRAEILTCTQQNLVSIMDQDVAKMALGENRALTEDLLRQFAAVVDIQTKALSSKRHLRDESAAPETPRKSARLLGRKST